MTTTYYAREDYTYSSGDAYFSIPFSYIDKEHIHVFINDEETTNFTFNTSSQVRVLDTLTAGDVVSIRRSTSIDERLVVFTDTSILNEENQNLSAQQVFNVVQECIDSNTNIDKTVREQLEEYEESFNEFQNVVDIEPISQSGYTITYRMTFKNGYTYDFPITNGTGSLMWKSLSASDWVQDGEVYRCTISGNYSVCGVYKGTVSDRTLVANVDVNVQGSTTYLISPDAFDGYALVADITNSEPAGVMTFTQAESSDTWVINHNLNTKPTVVVADSTGKVFEPDEITYTNNNTVTLKFIAAMTGVAYINYTR